MGTAAVFGLGSMGSGIAASLHEADHSVYGLDVVPASVEKFTASGGLTGQPADIASKLDAAIVVVLNAAQTESVLFGDTGTRVGKSGDGKSSGGNNSGIVESMRPGSVVVSCATAVSYTHLRAHETVLDLVCRLLLEKKK